MKLFLRYHGVAQRPNARDFDLLHVARMKLLHCLRRASEMKSPGRRVMNWLMLLTIA